MSEQQESLLPCPFCGGECDPIGWLRGDGVRGPECDECGATASSAEAWNRRAAEARAAVPAEPTRPANSQEWAGMDASTAYLLIQRHADGWADIDLMMNEWRLANPAAPQPVAQPSEPVPGVFVPGLGHQQGCSSHASPHAACNCGYTGSAFVTVTQAKPEQAAQPEAFPMILHEGGQRHELWLMTRDGNGHVTPLGSTGPVSLPSAWDAEYRAFLASPRPKD